MATIFKGHKNFKTLDFVCNWFLKTAHFIKLTQIKSGFVSTNSITMGEQVAPLWKLMIAMGIHIHFAHRTFSWESEAKGKAAVHVVIIGFADFDTQNKVLFDYADIKGEPQQRNVKNINPYLIDASEVIVESRSKPLCNVSSMVFGSMPNDGGFLLLTTQEKNEFIIKEPQADKWIRPLLGAEEFINGKERWCLWLMDIKPHELRSMPEVLKRVEAVKQYRLNSKRKATKKLGEIPAQFGENRQPLEGNYILVIHQAVGNIYQWAL